MRVIEGIRGDNPTTAARTMTTACPRGQMVHSFRYTSRVLNGLANRPCVILVASNAAASDHANEGPPVHHSIT